MLDNGCGTGVLGIFAAKRGAASVLAIDIDANAPKWRFKTVSRPRDVMTYRGIVYILLDRAIVALDNATGTLRAQIPLPWRANAFIQIGHKTYIDTPDIVFPWSLGL